MIAARGGTFQCIGKVFPDVVTKTGKSEFEIAFVEAEVTDGFEGPATCPGSVALEMLDAISVL